MIVHEVIIVGLKILLLIGLDIFTKHIMYVDTVCKKLCLPYLNIEIPLTRKYGHIFLAWPGKDMTSFTRQRLTE